jgi:outer membrane protein assembly factor BamB
MILLAILMQVQVDWEIRLFGASPGGWEPLAMSPDGFLVCVGYARPFPNFHGWAWAITPEGYTLWQYHSDTSLFYQSFFDSPAVSPTGKVYVGGRASLKDNPNVSLTPIFRFNPLNGSPIWSDTLSEPGASVSCKFTLVDPYENILLVCSRLSDASNQDILVASWDSSGNQRWVYRLDGTAHGPDAPIRAKTDQWGNLYIVGVISDTSGGCPGGNRYPLIMKLDTSGSPLWINAIITAPLSGYSVQGVALHGKWVYINGGGGGGNVFAARLDTATGEIDWFKMWYRNGPAQGTVWLSADASGNLYMGGGGEQGAWEVFSTDSLGNDRWKFDADSTDFNDPVCEIEIDSRGDLFAAGSQGEYPAVFKLDRAGNLLWSWNPRPPGFDGGFAKTLIPDNNGGVYVAGFYYTNLDGYPPAVLTAFIAHLIENQTVAENTNKDKELKLMMAPSGFLISGYEGEAQVYDPAGRLILTREIKSKTLISPLKPGVYFVVAGSQRAKVAVR